VIDVVRGAETQKVLERGHDRLPTFGVGSEQAKPYWMAFVRQMVAGGLLSINIQKYGCLEITPSGREILRGERAFEFREIRAREKPVRKPGVAKAAASLSSEDYGLLTRLKALRLELAKARGVPAYVIFSDATLIEMARERPADLGALAGINGVGPKKLADFGETFLAEIESATGQTGPV
jgi:ATP-dependent DNA helicase RecQ